MERRNCMSENEGMEFKNWPYCEKCKKPMAMNNLGSFCVNPDCGKELPPLGICVSDSSGVHGKMG